MPTIIVPTVLASSKDAFVTRWRKATSVSRRIQIDFMDGKFVPTTSIPLSSAPDVRPFVRDRHYEFEAHLMVRDPARWVPALLAKGFRRFIVHIESIGAKDFRALAAVARKERGILIAGINPSTAIRKLGPYLPSAGGICVLGVRPGRNGAPYDPRTPQRVRTIRLLCVLAGKRRPIQVDGGMTPATIGNVVHAGAIRINSGSYVGNATDPKRAYAELERAASAARPTRKGSRR
jgi:ribulose-phosphate 3-epimerase